MKIFRKLSFYSLISSLLFLSSCAETPQKFFDITVLNTNALNDFASPNLAQHIEDETKEFPDIPSSKKKGDEASTMIKNNIMYMEKSLKDIKALSANDDERKTIKAQSIALYELVIPVYKNEYTAYAKLCDSKAPQEQKDEIVKSIEQKYTAKFESSYGALLASGKAFAAKHNINVNWAN